MPYSNVYHVYCSSFYIAIKGGYKMNARLLINDLSKDEQSELFNIWHISKVHSHKRYDRLMYTVKWFIDKYKHYENNRTSIYKILDENTSNFYEISSTKKINENVFSF